jgi:tryptophan 2,3-dioxygenase
VLETMSPDGFLEFRDPLAPASGFQSVQFRKIEWISGLRDMFPEDATPPDGPGLYEAFVAAARLPEDREERLAQLADLYRDHERDAARAALHDVAELLVDHDEGIALWRSHHVLMAAREIGTRAGTGGSPGVPYLQATLGRRFFPELWDVRVKL